MNANRTERAVKLLIIIFNALAKLRMVCSSRCCESECRMNEKNNNIILEEDENEKSGGRDQFRSVGSQTITATEFS